jgi:transposase InsO family protein
VHTTYSTKKYAEVYLDQIVRLHGVPKTIISDRGPQFIARFWEQLQSALGTKLIRNSTYHPQTDGQTERVNQILEDMLRACIIHYVQAETNVLPWPNSLTTTVIKLVFRWLPLKHYTVEDVELL